MANRKKTGRSQKAAEPEVLSAKTRKKGIREEVLSAILFTLAVFLLVSIQNFQGAREDAEFIGVIGYNLMNGFKYALGRASLIVPVFLLFWSIHLGILKKTWSARMWGLTLFALAVLVAISEYHIPLGLNPWEAGIRGMGGGYIGGGLAYVINQLIGGFGVYIFLSLSFLLSLIMILEKPISEIGAWCWQKLRWLGAKLSNMIYYEEESLPSKATANEEPALINQVPEITPVIEIPSEPERVTALSSVKVYGAEEKASPAIPGTNLASKRQVTSEYVKPSLEMLSDIANKRVVDKKSIKESINTLEETFESFGVKVKVNQVSCGPAVTRYELTPAPGVKVSKILSLSDDLQLNLAASGIRIEAPIPGKSAIGIEIPNARVSGVGLRGLLASNAFVKLNSPQAFALGEDVTGNAVVANMNDMPHLLIAGSTGSGKSVCLNSIIMSMLFNATPDELKLILIDPKMVELTVYNGIPHLLSPVVTDPRKAAVILRWMTNEMEKRYRLFADEGVRDIYRFNAANREKLPFIVIVIDELADLMMVSPVEVEDSICRLAQMARAAGIHLIVATQRPSVDVITGLIKANIPSRIAFAVSSQADSRTILDMGGAEKLLGKGDMLFFPVGAVKPYRVQGAFVSDAEIEAVVNFLKTELPQNAGEQWAEIDLPPENLQEEYGDEIFWEAVKVFVESKKASVSLLQRKLRIGYSRAARLVDMMEERGIVSELDGNKKREVLLDSEHFEKLYANTKLC